MNIKYNRDEILSELRECVAEVHFTKVNGEKRVMRCTLKKNLLPSKYAEEETAEREFHRSNTDTIRCWDVNVNGWRSFKIDTVEYMQVLDVY